MDFILQDMLCIQNNLGEIIGLYLVLVIDYTLLKQLFSHSPIVLLSTLYKKIYY